MQNPRKSVHMAHACFHRYSIQTPAPCQSKPCAPPCKEPPASRWFSLSKKCLRTLFRLEETGISACSRVRIPSHHSPVRQAPRFVQFRNSSFSQKSRLFCGRDENRRSAEIRGNVLSDYRPSIQHQRFLRSFASLETAVLHWTAMPPASPTGRGGILSPRQRAGRCLGKNRRALPSDAS